MSSSSSPRSADRLFLFYLLILVTVGLVALVSASAPVGYSKFNDSYYFVKRQLLNGLLPGLILFFIFAKINYLYVRRLTWLIYIVALVLLSLVFVPGVGVSINGSQSWISLFGFTFQPAEFAKLALCSSLALILSDPNREWKNWQTLLPSLAVAAPLIILVLVQPDIGTLSILVAILFALLYLAETPPRFLFVLCGLAVAALALLIIIAPYRAQRLTTFLHPELDPQGVGYQINQAFLAVGSGGLWGVGYGHSRQKFQYLPEVSADSIFAVIAEENGFFISLLFIILLLLFIFRGYKIAKAAPDQFGSLLVAGIVTWLAWQSFLNIGAMVGALPLTGVPLPFVSHGGSALAMALAASGMVAGVSRGLGNIK